jgi:SAM-dependent methyltransferase
MAENIPSSSQLIEYWDSTASTKEFLHPLPKNIIEQYFPAGGAVLDFGCGYGRLAASLLELGFQVSGTDTSPAMLEKARRDVPGCEFRYCQNELSWADGSFDVVLLVALLTSVPLDLEQRQIMGEIRRVLKPGGCIFISDMPLQWSARYLERYEKGLKRYGQYGVFDIADGGILRHHDLGYFTQLMEGFVCLELETHLVTTMEKNQAEAFRYVGRLG